MRFSSPISRRRRSRALASRLAGGTRNPDALRATDESALLIALGPHVEDFLGALFGIESEVRALEARHHELAPLYAVKRLFVQRKAMNTHRADAAARLRRRRRCARDLEDAAGELVHRARVRRGGDALAAGRSRRTRQQLDVALRYAAWASHTPEGRRRAQGRRAVPRAAQARLHEPRAARG